MLQSRIVLDQVEAVVFDLAGTLAFYQSSQTNHNLSEIRLFPGIEELLRDLSDFALRLGIVSNSSGEFARSEFRRMGIIDCFQVMVFADEVGFAKPDERIFLTVCERFQLQAEKILLVGDSLSKDIAPAAKLGMQTFLFEQEKRAQQIGVLRELFGASR